LILAHCALYLYCASYTGQGNRNWPQKNAQSLKISPVLRGSYNPIFCPQSYPKPAQNHPRSTQNQLKNAENHDANPAQIALKKQLKKAGKNHCLSGCSAVTSTTHYKYSACAKSSNLGSGSQAKI
jgi:hypothetical protein